MKTVHIVVEKQNAHTLLTVLLKDLAERYPLQIHAARDSYAARPLARTLQVTRLEPVALVLDADTNNPQRADEDYASYKSYLEYTARGIPFTVILVMPNLETIFFEVPDVLTALTHQPLEPKDFRIGKAIPQLYLNELGVDWLKTVPSLTETQLQSLRTVPPIASLRQFIQDAAYTETSTAPHETVAAYRR